ncbi:histidine kinase/DNA gyrase B/HSP90-like ATPase [Chthoniobacter flavus]|uniref:sensor histidine kinase n=1 Tax=Chthoniobacter flavus TaxID=191863 RepID=UPI0010462B89|nr:sensor histidine kinase [Chthoniobacter flavus]TCO89910.1 histidine kinase/DNA gyrase B/HSP90-like ATPase [Chthoniobacter flavus]
MANPPRFLPALLLLFFAHTCLPAESSPLGELTTAVSIRSLSDAEAARGRPVRLQGIIAEVHDKTGVFLLDDSEGIYVRLAELTGTITQGDRVEVVGTTAAGLYAPCIENATLQLLGKGELPAPRLVTFAEIASGHDDAQWVEVRGVIHTVVYTQWHQPRFLLVMDGGRMEVRAEKPVKGNLDALVDAEVRCRGVIGGRFSKFRQLVAPEMQIQTEKQITIGQAAPTDPFAVRPRTVSQLLQFDPHHTFQHRVKLTGTVLHSESGESVFLRDLSGPIRIETHDSLALVPGDQIEALGFPAMGQYGPFLEDATIRATGRTAALAPIAISVPELLKNGKDSDLIRLDAEMLWITRQAKEAVLTLRSGDATFVAALQPTDRSLAALPELASGSLLRLTGICQFQGQRLDRVTNAMVLPETFSLRLRSPEDIVVLRGPPWWSSERLLRIVALLVAFAAAALLWVWQLKRRVRAQGEVLSRQVRREAVLEERHRVAMEIHDTLAQGFTAIWVQLSVIKEKLFDSPGNALPHLEMAQRLVRKSLGDARRSIRDLNDCTFLDQDLARALAAIGEELTKGGAVRLQVDASGDAPFVPATVSSQLLRIGQEAITNAIKHANARLVRVELKYGSHFVLLRVKDDGAGFDPAQFPHVVEGGGFGLIGMQERARQIGGELSIDSTPGGGAEIVVVAPVDSQRAAQISADEPLPEPLPPQ